MPAKDVQVEGDIRTFAFGADGHDSAIPCHRADGNAEALGDILWCVNNDHLIRNIQSISV
jgi:hypothetical protein